MIHLERQRGRRIVQEVLHVEDYDRTAQQFRTEMVYDAGPDKDRNPAQYALPFPDSAAWNIPASHPMEQYHAVC